MRNLYLYLNENKVIKSQNIIGIFDLDSTTVSKKTRNFLQKSQKKDKISTVDSELPKSFLLCETSAKDDEVVINKFSPKTLLNRLNQPLKR